jgi:hypothetical protein
MFALADRLNRPLGDVLAMSRAEFVLWLAHCNLTDRERPTGSRR